MKPGTAFFKKRWSAYEIGPVLWGILFLKNFPLTRGAH